ncbi:MAG: DUF5615 family PIN-like protein [Stellaceae bacterium]
MGRETRSRCGACGRPRHERAPDSEIVKRASADGRTVVTADLDYPRLLALAGAVEPSLILFRGGDWSDEEIIARMADILARSTERDIMQCILVIDRNRIRRRRLPVR